MLAAVVRARVADQALLQRLPSNDDPSALQDAPADRLSGMLAAVVSARVADEALLQRLPSNNNDPTANANGTYWDRVETTQQNGKTVPKRTTAYMRSPSIGGVPSVSPPGWDWLQTHVGKLKGRWVRFHIINRLLGGPGNQTSNLIPTSVAVNNAFSNHIETDAKDSAKTNARWTYVDVKMTYNAAWPAPIPTHIRAEWGDWDAVQGTWVMRAQHNFVNPDITLIDQGIVYLRGDNITVAQMTQRGVPLRHAGNFTKWLKAYRQNDDDDSDFQDAVRDAGWDTDWLEQIWLDEDDSQPNSYEPVVKAM